MPRPWAWVLGAKALGLGAGFAGASAAGLAADAKNGALQDRSMADMVAAPGYYAAAQNSVSQMEGVKPSAYPASAQAGVAGQAGNLAKISGLSAAGGLASTGLGAGVGVGAGALPAAAGAMAATLTPAARRIMAAVDSIKNDPNVAEIIDRVKYDPRLGIAGDTATAFADPAYQNSAHWLPGLAAGMRIGIDNRDIIYGTSKSLLKYFMGTNKNCKTKHSVKD